MWTFELNLVNKIHSDLKKQNKGRMNGEGVAEVMKGYHKYMPPWVSSIWIILVGGGSSEPCLTPSAAQEARTHATLETRERLSASRIREDISGTY